MIFIPFFLGSSGGGFDREAYSRRVMKGFVDAGAAIDQKREYAKAVMYLHGAGGVSTRILLALALAFVVAGGVIGWELGAGSHMSENRYLGVFIGSLVALLILTIGCGLYALLRYIITGKEWP